MFEGQSSICADGGGFAMGCNPTCTARAIKPARRSAAAGKYCSLRGQRSWGVHPMVQRRLLNYSHGMNEQHYFQSQKTEDLAHLGSIHAHAPVSTTKNNQRHTDVKPSHDEIAERAHNLFTASGSIPGHDFEHWFQAEAQMTAA